METAGSFALFCGRDNRRAVVGNASVTSSGLYRAEQVREFDRRAIELHGIRGYALMTRAAAAALQALRTRWPQARRLRVLCGAGNNAGDGYVLARLARQAGLDVAVGWLCDPATLRGDARTAADDAAAAQVPIGPFAPPLLGEAEVIVDALLGTGLTRPLAGEWAAAVAAANAAAVPVLSLDVPSGLQADTGAILGEAIRAALTVTFIAPKLGLFTGTGPDCAGEVRLADLDVPAAVFDGTEPAAMRVTAADLPAWLPGPRARSAHKGAFGHVLVVGGQPGMSGAARLAAEAAARVGAGLVSVATHPAHAALLNIGRPELMCRGVQTPADLEPLLARAGVMAIGPGLGQDDWARGLLTAVLGAGLPCVLDADALNLLAAAPARRDDWILTPHPGEAARLLGCTAAAVQADRPAAVRALQARCGGVVVLKGAGTLVHDGRRTWVISAGNPGMASGGMGDVLTGVIAGLLAQGLAPAEAAVAGTLVHGLAGDTAAATGERGLLAGDLFDALRQWVNPRVLP